MENRIRALRARLGWSQAALAGRLEVSRQTVNAIENGRYDPSLPLAFAISRVFGMSIEEIFEDPDRSVAGSKTGTSSTESGTEKEDRDG